jgi:excisionase family DNA binding protein
VTAKITVERTGDQQARLTLAADVQISEILRPLMPAGGAAPGVNPAAGPSTPGRGGPRQGDLLTVEETAEILHIGRDKVCYLLRTGRLRSIKIGKLRRTSRPRITEFAEGPGNPEMVTLPASQASWRAATAALTAFPGVCHSP